MKKVSLYIVSVIAMFVTAGCATNMNPMAPGISFVESGEPEAHVRWAGFIYNERLYNSLAIVKMKNVSTDQLYEIGSWRYAASVPPGEYQITYADGSELRASLNESRAYRTLCQRAGRALVRNDEILLTDRGERVRVFYYTQGRERCHPFIFGAG